MDLKIIAIFIFLLSLAGNPALFSLNISDYSYQLNNGIRVITENGWKKAEVVQEFTNDADLSTNRGAVRIHFNFIGDLVDMNPDITLFAASKPKSNLKKLSAGIRSEELTKGKYTASVKFPLQGQNGTLSFKITDIPVKENAVTVLNMTINDIQLVVDEQPGDGWKLTQYQFVTFWAKDKMEGGGYTGYPTVFKAKEHYQMITPVEIESDTKAKMRPGSYDFYLDTDISKARYRYTCWIENVKMESNKTYQFKFNLNGSRVRTGIADDNPKQIGFYPTGTAATQKPRENKKLMLYTVVEPWKSAICPTGTYDVLLSFDYGARNEWRTNVVFNYGEETVVK